MEKFKRERDSKWLEWRSLLSSWRVAFAREKFQSVKQLLLFAGYPRSGHTLIGAVLDAHPEVVLAHELDALKYFEKGLSGLRVMQMIEDNSTRYDRAGREWMGYKYRIPGQWQGKYRTISVIGDKSGGITGRRFLNPGAAEVMVSVEQRTGLQPTFLHVIRNPYDIIATMTNRTTTRREESLSEAFFERKAGHFFQHADGVAKLKAAGNYRVIDVYHEDFVADPAGQLAQLCEKLHLPATEGYLTACAGIVWKKPSRSRALFPFWNEASVARVADKMKEYPWFNRYQFTESSTDE